MSVTLEVFQLDTFSLNVVRFLKSPFMSVIEETSHSEMGPYIISAEAAELVLLHSRTAVFRVAVVVKVHAPRPLQAEPCTDEGSTACPCATGEELVASGQPRCI